MKRWLMVCGFVLTLSATVEAGVSPSACDDLSGVPVTPNVDFSTQIQPLFNSYCTGCHGGSGGLTLSAGVAYGNLVSVPPSAPVPVNRVEPGDASQSFLFWKLNCANPGSGSRMPIGGTLSPEEQAMIRDWINQGALPAAAAAATPVPGLSVAGMWTLVLLLLALGLSRSRLLVAR